MRHPNFARIAELNDLARSAMGVACRAYTTPGIRALPPEEQSAIRELVETFADFTPGNDPHGEHDCAAFDFKDTRILWKIDYYDRACEYGSEDPSEPAQTVRVLTIMLAEEY